MQKTVSHLVLRKAEVVAVVARGCTSAHRVVNVVAESCKLAGIAVEKGFPERFEKHPSETVKVLQF